MLTFRDLRVKRSQEMNLFCNSAGENITKQGNWRVAAKKMSKWSPTRLQHANHRQPHISHWEPGFQVKVSLLGNGAYLVPLSLLDLTSFHCPPQSPLFLLLEQAKSIPVPQGHCTCSSSARNALPSDLHMTGPSCHSDHMSPHPQSSPDHPTQSRPQSLLHVTLLISLVLSLFFFQLCFLIHFLPPEYVKSVRAEPGLIALHHLPRAQNHAWHRTGPQSIFDDWANIEMTFLSKRIPLPF